MYRNRLFQLLIAVALIVSAVGGYAALTDSAEAAQQPEVQVLKFDIAEDGNRFAFDEEPVYLKMECPLMATRSLPKGISILKELSTVATAS